MCVLQRALDWDSEAYVPGPTLPLDMWPWVSHSVSFIKQGGWTKWSLCPFNFKFYDSDPISWIKKHISYFIIFSSLNQSTIHITQREFSDSQQ